MRCAYNRIDSHLPDSGHSRPNGHGQAGGDDTDCRDKHRFDCGAALAMGEAQRRKTARKSNLIMGLRSRRLRPVEAGQAQARNDG